MGSIPMLRMKTPPATATNWTDYNYWNASELTHHNQTAHVPQLEGLYPAMKDLPDETKIPFASTKTSAAK